MCLKDTQMNSQMNGWHHVNGPEFEVLQDELHCFYLGKCREVKEYVSFIDVNLQKLTLCEFMQTQY